VGDTWEKTARASEHMLRTPKAWAVDLADLDAAERCGLQCVDIHDLEGLRHYWATLATVRRRGFGFERGHGRQWALPLEHWRPSRDAALALDAADSKPPEPEPGEPVQMALFGQAVRHGR
jgi:hypothetical protein